MTDATEHRVRCQCVGECSGDPNSPECRHITVMVDAIPKSAAEVPKDWLKQSVEATPGSFEALQDGHAIRNRVLPEYRDLAERILARIHPAMNWYPDASGAENRIARVTGGEPALVDILAQALEAEGV